MGRSSFIVAIAVAATIVTLLSSSSMLNSSAALNVHHSIQVLGDVSTAVGGMRSAVGAYISSDAPPIAGTAAPTDIDMAAAGDLAAHCRFKLAG